jgi:hypothetical protein
MGHSNVARIEVRFLLLVKIFNQKNLKPRSLIGAQILVCKISPLVTVTVTKQVQELVQVSNFPLKLGGFRLAGFLDSFAAMSSKSAASKVTSSTAGALQGMSQDSAHTDKNEASSRSSAASLSGKAESTGTTSGRDTAATGEAGSHGNGSGDKTKKLVKPKSVVSTSVNKGGGNPGVIPRDQDASAPAASQGKHGHTSGTIQQGHSSSNSTAHASAQETKPKTLADFIGKKFTRDFHSENAKGGVDIQTFEGEFTKLQWVSLRSKLHEACFFFF